LPIRFRLAAEDVDRIAFAYSPLLEAVLSLHVLTEPKHHPLQHPWVREMRRLPPALKREIDTFSFLYRYTLPNCLLPPADEALLDFDTELGRVRNLDAATIAYELTRPLHDHGGGEAHLDDPYVIDAIRVQARRHGTRTPEVVERLLEDPPAVGVAFADLLQDYWQAAFAAEWSRLEPQLADSVTAAGRHIADHGIYSFLRTLPYRLRVDPEQEEFGLDIPHDHTVALDGDRSLVLVPSVYVWPHVNVNCDDPWPLCLVYPSPAIAERKDQGSPELLRALRALGDGTRLRALKLIAERPRSTQELAPLVGISEAGLSKHLRVLAGAGLLETRREGYYVLYGLVPGAVRAVADALPRVVEKG
jgi:DNA-binding transcriptional ArsR family regulator